MLKLTHEVVLFAWLHVSLGQPVPCVWQTPPLHCWPEVQTTPGSPAPTQPPQCVVFDSGSMHSVPHWRKPGRQTHCPAVQTQFPAH